jgi:HEAT repeat protein
MWSLLTQGALVALAPLGPADGAPPPGAALAISPAEQRVASALRRSRLERTKESEAFAREISAGGPAVLRPCLDTLELQRVACVSPSDVEQMLSSPQREILLLALAELPSPQVLSGGFERLALSQEPAVRRLMLDVLQVAGAAAHLAELDELALGEGEALPRPELEESFQAALAGILRRDPRAYDQLATFHRDAPEPLADAIVRAVGDAGDTRGLSFLEHAITFRTSQLSLCASQVKRLGRSGDRQRDADLAQRLRWAVDPDRPEACRALFLALGELRDSEAVPILIEFLSSADAGLAGNAHWALRRITDLEFPPLPERWSSWYESELEWFVREQDFVLRDLHSGSLSAATAAVRAISERRLWREELADELLSALQRPRTQLRAPICRALERLGVQSAAEGLVDMLDDGDPASVQAALRALTALTGRELPADSMTWRLALASDS